MNKTTRDELCAALRSGKYKQGWHYLRRDDSYSCLGVLCDISNAGVWQNTHNDGVFYYTVNDIWSACGVVPFPADEDLGLYLTQHWIKANVPVTP